MTGRAMVPTLMIVIPLTIMFVAGWLAALVWAGPDVSGDRYERQSELLEAAVYGGDEVVADGFGGEWIKCDSDDCDLHVVRPGKIQCSGICDVTYGRKPVHS